MHEMSKKTTSSATRHYFPQPRPFIREEFTRMQNLMVTGGAGFIGSNFVRYMLDKYPDYHVVVYDKLTYAGNLDNLLDVDDDPRYAFVQGDICDAADGGRGDPRRTRSTPSSTSPPRPTWTAPSWTPTPSSRPTSTAPTCCWRPRASSGWSATTRSRTDEVYGHVHGDHRSLETDSVAPRSPYAASKASGDLMAIAYHVTYGLPVTITRGANNIGPYQYPEKVVPLFVTNAIDDLPLPVYGDGKQRRDYQYVLDHCEAIDLVLHKGQIGRDLQRRHRRRDGRTWPWSRSCSTSWASRDSLIQHVDDRPGHDRRYCLNVDKLEGAGLAAAPHPRGGDPRRRCAGTWTTSGGGARSSPGEFKEYYRQLYGERKVISRRAVEGKG